MDLIRPMQRIFTGKLRVITLFLLFGIVFVYCVRFYTHTLYLNRVKLVDPNSIDYLEHVHSSKDLLNYAVVIDAGSSGSRCHIYVWPPHTGDRRRLLQIRMLKDKFGKDIYRRISPGLSSNAKHPEKSFDYIYPLMQFAMQHIPTEKWLETPLYILATAGMRLLSVDVQNRILENLRVNIAKNGTFNFNAQNVQVITGKEEGIYSWISINYLLEKFDHSLDSNQLTAINLNGIVTTRPRTVGMLEIGGASMQIAFEITNKYELDEIKHGFETSQSINAKGPNYLAEFNLGCDSHATDHSYLLYVSTYLGLGANMGKNSYVHHLFHDYLNQNLPMYLPNKFPGLNFVGSNATHRLARDIISTVEHNHDIRDKDSMLPGDEHLHTNSSNDPKSNAYSDTVRNKSMNFFAPKVGNVPLPVPEISIMDPCLPLNARSKENITDHNGNKYHVTFLGSGDFDACEAKVAHLLDPATEQHLNCSNEENCPLTVLNRLRIPYANSEFYGFSEFWYSMEDILRIGGLYNYFSFKKAAQEYCSTDWDVLSERHRKGLYPLADKTRMLTECFKSAWIVSVLHTGFRMPKGFNQFRSALKIRDNEVQWTLGALLYRTRFFPLRDIPNGHSAHGNFIKSTPSPYWYGQLAFIGAMFIVVMCIVIYLRHLHDYVHRPKPNGLLGSSAETFFEVKITDPLIKSEV